jgi:tetratricopeptide (TPR) repeat protein
MASVPTFAEAVDLAKRLTAAAATPADWERATATWVAITDAVETADLPPATVAAVLNLAAGAQLQRAWEDDEAIDALERAIDLYRRAIEAAASDDSDRLAYFFNLGQALRTLWQRTRIASHLADAIDALAAAADSAETATAAHAGVYEALGNALFDSGDLDAAVEHLRTAVELHDEDDAPAHLSNLGSALLGRFEARGRREDLEEAVRLLEAVVAMPEPSAQMLANLGNALSTRAGAQGDLDDADRAVVELRKAVARSVHAPQLPAMLSNLAAALLERHDLTGAIADIEEAVERLERAVAGTPRTNRDRAPRLANLASALRLRQLRRRTGRSDLDRAVRCCEDALELTSETDEDRVTYHANLGNVLHQRYDVTHDQADLTRAIAELERAVERTAPGSPDRPTYLNNLSATLAARGDHERSAADLRRAASLLNEALALRDRQSAHRPGLLVNLGNARSELARLLRSREDRIAARTAYREAARDGLATNPGDALAAACNWSEWAIERCAWSEVVQAYSCGSRAASSLLRAQILRMDKEAWLRDAQGLSGNGAYALALRAEVADALMALETGRALLSSGAFARDRADLERLEHGHDVLARRYRSVAARLAQLERRNDEASVPRPSNG